MRCIKFPGGVVCVGGPTYVDNDETGKEWRWEFHPYLGPTVLNKNDSIKSRQPGRRSKFWPVFNRWIEKRKEKHD